MHKNIYTRVDSDEIATLYSFDMQRNRPAIPAIRHVRTLPVHIPRSIMISPTLLLVALMEPSFLSTDRTTNKFIMMISSPSLRSICTDSL